VRWTRFALMAVGLAALVVSPAQSAETNTSGLAVQTVLLSSPAPTNRPGLHPDPNYPVSGRVIQLIPGGMVLDSAGRQIEISFNAIVTVWRETSVTTNAIEVGDDLFIDDGQVSANIGRIDGVIREIDATGMLVDVHLRWGGSVLQRVDFSPYIEYGAASSKLTRSDLVVGRMIGAVVYRPPGGTLRVTRIW
jgi:hypothetical protein